MMCTRNGLSLRFLRRRNTHIIIVCSILATFLFFRMFPYFIVDFGYLVRPIWDKPSDDWDETIIHYHAEGMTMEERCRIHGWTYTNNTAAIASGAMRKPRTFDAVIFSVELDMLEIRMRELFDVVDKFVILEANRTFTGLPKTPVFAQNRDRFAFAEDKIIYRQIELKVLEPDELPWVNEGAMRDAMTELLWSSGIQENDHIIFSDVDELPSRHTIELLSSCTGVPDTVHLHLRNYMYSYEFPLDDEGKSAPSFRRWPKENIYYVRRQGSRIRLANAGWHCTFCFRTLDEFRFKLQAYSHQERFRYKYMLDESYLQDVICNGKDLTGMYPEAFTFKDLIHRLGPVPKSLSAVGLPTWVLKNPDKFKFLLPGGCRRE